MPGRIAMPSTAAWTGRWLAAAVTVASTPRLRAGTCSTTNTAAGRSGTRAPRIVFSGAVAPEEPPMTTMSRLVIAGFFIVELLMAGDSTVAVSANVWDLGRGEGRGADFRSSG